MLKFNMYGRGKPLQWAITITCSLSFIFFGYDQGFMGGVLAIEGFMQAVGNPTPSVIGIMFSIFNLGCASGCLANILWGSKLGRRRALFLAYGWLTVGVVIQTSSNGLAQLLVGRFVAGVGMGFISSTVPTYQSELCEANKRGRLTCSQIVMISTGLVLSIFFDYGISKSTVTNAWRIPIAFQLAFVMTCAILLLGVPESPRWLFQQDRGQEALRVLCDVYDKAEDDLQIQQERDEILKSIQISETHRTFSFRSLYEKDEVQTAKRIWLAAYVASINQLAGVNLIVYYMPTVLIQNVGVSPDKAILISGGVDSGVLVGTIVLTLLVDKIGRRRPLMFSALATGICMMLIAILLRYRDLPAHGHAISMASITFFALFMFAYGLGSGTLGWAFVPEILPLHARVNGAALAAICNWMLNFTIAMISPVLVANIGWKLYIIWTCTNFASVPLIYFFIPEVKNLTLEEVDLIFTEPGSSSVTVAKRLQRIMKEQGQEQIREILVGKMAEVAHVEKVPSHIEMMVVPKEVSS